MARSEIVPIDRRRDVVRIEDRASAVVNEVRALQEMTRVTPSRAARRVLFLWFRVFVLEQKGTEKAQRVNVRIPIPLPVLGLLFPRSIGWQHALSAIAAGRDAPEPSTAIRDQLDSVMALELVRVEEEKHGKRQLVVVGLD